MKYKRSERVSALVLQELATIIEKGVRDPDIGFVTLTSVHVTDDLRTARVYVVPRGTDEERKRTMEALTGAVPRLRKELGHNLELKYVPTLQFYPDQSFEHAENIDRLIDQIHEEEQGR